MTPEHHDLVKLPTRLLATALGLTLATCSLVVLVAYTGSRLTLLQGYDTRLERLNGEVMRLDEVLTMSARMAAETGDPGWEQRYRQHEPELDAAIKETMALASDVSGAPASTQTDAANAELVAMENRAFALVRDRRSQDARALLSSPRYEGQKTIYAAGMTAVMADLRTRTDSLDQETRSRTLLLVGGATVCFGLSLWTWVAVLRSLRRNQRTLAAEVKNRTAELRETAAYLQNLIDHANAPIVVWNPAFEITRFNHAFERLTGRSASEVLGKGIDILLPEDTREEWMVHLRGTVTGERWETLELPILQADGRVRTLLWNSATLFDSDGRTPVATIAQGQDITGRQQAEEALRASEARHRTVLETAMDGFWRMDLQGRLTEVNEAYCRMSGYSEQELLGMSVYALSVVGTSADVVARLQQIVAKRELRFESRHRRKDGSAFDVEVSVQYRPEEGDQCVVFLHDITERKRANQALRESEHQLQLVLEGSMEGFWDHDVRTDVLLFSPRCAALLAVSPDRMPSTIAGFVALMHPDDASIFRGAVADHFEGRTTGVDVEFRLRADSSRWVQTRGRVAERDADGHPVRVAGTLSDVTQRKQAEHALRQSEARLRDITSSMADWVWEVDENGVYTYVSPPALELFGDVIGKTPFDLMAPDEVRRVAGLFAEIAAHKAPIKDLENWNIRKDGERICLLTNGVPVLDEAGNLKGYRGVDQDITGRKRVEEALARLSRRNAAVLTSAGEGIIGLDSDGNHTFVSPSAAAMLRYEAEDMIGTPSHSLWHHTKPDGRPYPREECSIYGTAFRDGIAVRRSDEVFWRKDGTSFPVEFVSTPLLERDKLAGAVVVFSDITERRRAEETLTQTNQMLLAEIATRQTIQVELVEARDAAVEATRLKAEFLANMSHEIRTPMNGVIGMTELALDTDLTVQQREYLDMAKGSAESLLRIVNDILDFSKIEAGRLALDPAEFRLRDTLDDTLKPLALRAARKGLELFCDVQGDVPDTLVADAGRLRQVLVNLLGNAIKFTEAGEVLVSVRAEQQDVPDPRDALLHVAVSDTGIGIPIDKQKMIFDAFSQADGSITRTHGGTGLGLTISSKLVQMMGGSIRVESIPGHGTTFHFTVRVRVQETQAPAEIVPPALVGLPVLVVDDNATNRRILEKTLEKWRMRPTLVESGEAALAAVRAADGRGHPFPLMLLDVTMPGMDGFTVATRLTEDRSLVQPAIVMLTSSGGTGDAARCRELGIGAYLIKPVRQTALREAVLAALGRPALRAVATPSPEPPRGPSLRVLLAEDNLVNQRVALGVLEGVGHVVTVAANGREALAALEASVFDLVLMDEQMPEMSGSEATASVRARERVSGGHLPIIALTAHALAGDRDRCLAAGADGYVAKPIVRTELFREIDAVVSHAGAAPTRMRPAAAFDEAGLLARVGGNRVLLQEVIGLFLEDCPRLVDAIRRGLADGDAAAVYRVAHTLKGSAGNFGGEDAIAVMQRLEASAREGDLSACGRDFAVLEPIINRLMGELTSVREVA